MALVTTPLKAPIGNALVTESVTGATADNDVRAGATTVYMIDVDNTANGAVSYLKMWNNAAPTVGTTAPDRIEMIPAATRLVIAIPQGLAFATSLSFAGLTAGGTAGTTPPTSSMITRIVCT